MMTDRHGNEVQVGDPVLARAPKPDKTMAWFPGIVTRLAVIPYPTGGDIQVAGVQIEGATSDFLYLYTSIERSN